MESEELETFFMILRSDFDFQSVVSESVISDVVSDFHMVAS